MEELVDMDWYVTVEVLADEEERVEEDVLKRSFVGYLAFLEG